jgi:sodium transport system permease protein
LNKPHKTGNAQTTKHLSITFHSFGDDALLIIGIAILISVIYAMFIASVLMVTSIIGKTVKESQSYSTPIMMLVTIPALTTTNWH